MAMQLKHLNDVELSDDESAALDQMQAQADRDAVEERKSRTIAIRWGSEQLQMIRRAAELRGIPYQIYIKNAAWEVARQDLERAHDIHSPVRATR
jgi:predicted DNA binding CopG/RHH family protein